MRASSSLIAGIAFFAAGPVSGTPLGLCKFDEATLSFAGDAADQARCLLRPVAKFGKIGAPLSALPTRLASLVGKNLNVDGARLKHALATRSISVENFDRSVSRARNGASSAPMARYIVIHDTSSPWLGDDPFPADIDTSARVNGLKGYLGPNSVAHVFVSRSGTTVFGHDFSVPWRATKLETKVIGVPAKGLFLHVENIQPRRREPAGGPKNDAIAPLPGLTSVQYDRLAALYVYASRRAGRWLIPAFHTALDAGLNDGHDDPQNFELAKFDQAIGAILTEIAGQ